MQRRFGALALFAILLLFLMPLRAEAHAGLVRSVPAIGETQPTAPAAIELEFNEDLDPSFSTVQLFDSQNTLIDPGPGAIDPANPRVLRLPLDGLPNGSYTAIFKLRSALDGHTTSGGIPFGVGVAAATTSLLPPPGT
ncbi:MAG: copper resistance protein CopC, partial [Roseiflexaceae bacterium]|nr:copper resistance protein CopC [Roseiflexaceae bacterium]